MEESFCINVEIFRQAQNDITTVLFCHAGLRPTITQYDNVIALYNIVFVHDSVKVTTFSGGFNRQSKYQKK